MEALIRAAIGLAIIGAVYGVFTRDEPDKPAVVNVIDNVKGLISPPVVTQPKLANGAYGLGDVPTIVNASKRNEISFDTYYKGHTFDAVMPFAESNAHWLGGGYRVSFGDSVDCREVADASILGRIADWRKGTIAHVVGIMDRTSFGTIVLTGCHITGPDARRVIAEDKPAPVAPAALPAGDIDYNWNNETITEQQIGSDAEAIGKLLSPIPAPAPAPSASLVVTSLGQGYTDRQAWERWFASLTGDYRTGAFYWSGQRSLAHPGSCVVLGGEAVAGCLAAKARLDFSDVRRKTDPEYRIGWNMPR